MREEPSLGTREVSQGGKRGQQAPPALRVYLLQGCRLEWVGGPAAQEIAWYHRSSARALFILLLCAPKRQASRSQLAGLLWPETDEEKANDSLRSALKYLRDVLRSGQGEDLLEARGGTLTFKGQEHLWLDIDAITDLVRQARNTPPPHDALLLWKQARALLCEDLLIEDRTSEWSQCPWIKVRRQELRAARRAMIRALSDFYLQSGQHGHAEELLHAHVIRFPTDQDALYHLMKLLMQSESFEEARTYYERCRIALADLGKQPAEHIKALAQECRSRPQKIVTAWRDEQKRQREHITADITDTTTLSHTPLAHLSDSREETSPSFSFLAAQGILEATSVLEGNAMDPLRRRVLRQVLEGASVATLASYNLALGLDAAERLTKALTKPSSIDETLLRYLEIQVQRYWRDRQSAIVASHDLLGYTWDHLQKIITLLEGALSSSARLSLCATASETAQLIGESLLDMGAYAQAKKFHETAISAAREAQNLSLETIAWGRTSLAWLYIGNTQEALTSVQRARHLAAKKTHPHIQAWLAAIEAEAQARLFSSDSCLRALDDAALIEDNKLLPNEIYLVHFDSSLLAGYQGASFRYLCRSEAPQCNVFLQRAQTALMDALVQLDSGLIQRRPTFLADLADISLQQGEIEGACQYATEALTIAAQIKLQKVIQRLLAFQQQLAPWKDTSYVRSFDVHLASLPEEIRTPLPNRP